MRIWDVDVALLCRAHLLGEHRELHALWTILTQDKAGYRAHPETRRWAGKLAALYKRHEQLVAEMTRRGYRHASPLDRSLATGRRVQRTVVTPLADQMRALRDKPCECPLTGSASRNARAQSASKSSAGRRAVRG